MTIWSDFDPGINHIEVVIDHISISIKFFKEYGDVCEADI